MDDAEARCGGGHGRPPELEPEAGRDPDAEASPNPNADPSSNSNVNANPNVNTNPNLDPVFDDSVLRLVRTREPYGLRVQGEIDAARHAAFERALCELGGKNEVHLDLAELRFIDLGGLGLLAEQAVKSSRKRTIVLDRVPPQLRMVMEIVGWQRLPGLRLGRPSEVEAV